MAHALIYKDHAYFVWRWLQTNHFSPFSPLIVLGHMSRRWMLLLALPGCLAQTPTMSVSTRLVQVEVIVQDSHGDARRGLTKDDFILFDRGKRQKIRVFEVADHDQAVPDREAIAGAKPADLPFSNRVATDRDAPNTPTVIVIDARDSWSGSGAWIFADLWQAREALVKFLGQVRPQDRLGIYFLGPNGFWIFREYNQDCTELIERLATWKGSASPGLKEAYGSRPTDGWTEFALHFIHVDRDTAKAIHRAQFWEGGGFGSTPGASQPNFPALRGGASRDPNSPVSAGMGFAPNAQGVFMPTGGGFGLMSDVANHLAAIPGRKNVIWLSTRVVVPAENEKRLDALRGVFRTGVSLYPIDPQGLMTFMPSGSFRASTVNYGPSTPHSATAIMEEALSSYGQAKKASVNAFHMSLRWLAEETGGKASVDTNDIAGAIRSAFEDTRLVYMLGFYPGEQKADGSYHPLKVTVSQPGLSVRARSGYFESGGVSRTPESRANDLYQATWSPVDAGLVELRGEIVPAGPPLEPAFILNLKIGVAGLLMQPTDGLLSTQFEAVLVQRDNAGNEYGRWSQTIAVKLKQSKYDQLLERGLAYTRSLPRNPKATSVRAIVRDSATGNIGTLTIPFEPFAR